MEYIIIIGAFQALLALCLFLANRRRKPADHLLTWILICICTHLTIKFIIYTASGNTQLKAAFNTFIDLGYGPLLWMYARKVRNDHYRPAQHWYLLVPSLAASFIYALITWKLLTDPADSYPWLYWYNTITEYLIIGSMTLFPLLSLSLARKLPAFWHSEAVLIRFIARCFLITPFLWLGTHTLNAGQWIDGATLNLIVRVIAYTNMLLISLSIIRYRLQSQALQQEAPAPAALTDLPTPVVLLEKKESLVVAVQEDATPRKSVLSSLQQEAIAIKLAVLMQEKKSYTDPELTLERLSTLTKTPRHHLSEVLNQHLHQTFYQYINDHRMKEVLRLLDQCRQQQVAPNILSLAFEAGFNSKSSFNQYFKKTTGYTPTEYLKQPSRQENAPLSPPFRSLSPRVQAH